MAQLSRVHRRKTATGELKYVRVDDDGAAACEDMVEAWDGKPHIVIQKTLNIRPKARPPRRQPAFARRV